jgi:hypothetical protein
MESTLKGLKLFLWAPVTNGAHFGVQQSRPFRPFVRSDSANRYWAPGGHVVYGSRLIIETASSNPAEGIYIRLSCTLCVV